MDLKLQGKVAVVTGGSRGIGRRIAQRFAEEGCHVGICARGKEEVERAASELRELGVEVFSRAGDVTEAEVAEGFINGAADALGGIDILVANVGGSSGGRSRMEEATDEDWLRTFQLNLFHAVRCTRLALPHFRKRGGGSVTIISSISGRIAGGYPQYGAAKAAEIHLAGELAIQLAPENVRVNAVCPGSIIWEGGGWDRVRSSRPQEFEEFLSREFPAGRLGSPEEVADVVVFLNSERASWINGALIPVDGAQRRPAL